MYLYDDQLMTIPDNIYDTFFFVEYKLKVVVPPPPHWGLLSGKIKSLHKKVSSGSYYPGMMLLLILVK